MAQRLAELGAREWELLALAAQPMSAKEIARETGLSVGTVNNYLSSAQRRLGARNRVEAVRMFKVQAGDSVKKVHMNFVPLHETQADVAKPVAELKTHMATPLRGLADSTVPRSRASLEAFLGSVTKEDPRLLQPSSLDWRKRLCVILLLTIAIAFAMASVVILLDALTRFTTTA